MMYGNNTMMMIMQMMGQAGGNPQAMVQEILRNNPQFAQQIQGKDVSRMAQDMLRQRGIDPAQIQNMFPRR